MAEKSAIEWTDATWNPVTGCTKVSPACANCYIERTPPFRVRNRVFVNGHIPLEFHENRLDQPLRRKKPTVYFVNSLSDLFHEGVPFEFIKRVWDVIAQSPQHTFQILTKRPARLLEFHRWLAGGDDISITEWPRNAWLGVSVENQHFADERIPMLLRVPAAVRFLSMEPLLGPVTFRWAAWDDHAPNERRARQLPPVERDGRVLAGSVDHLDGLRMLDWVIVGGESGPHTRPTNPEWVRSIRDQCRTAGVWFFFKQWGGRTSKSGGRVLDGRTWDEMPEVRA